VAVGKYEDDLKQWVSDNLGRYIKRPRGNIVFIVEGHIWTRGLQVCLRRAGTREFICVRLSEAEKMVPSEDQEESVV
jgi:hypothetical protein